MEISTHLLYSATPSASLKIFISAFDAFVRSASYFLITSKAAFNFGNSLNCLLTSSIILIAALPTAFIERAEKTNGNIAPIRRPDITMGLEISIEVI